MFGSRARALFSNMPARATLPTMQAHFEYLGYVCDSIAAVSNMRLDGKDVFAESSSIFDRPMPAKAASA